jgi:hypothetical protein
MTKPTMTNSEYLELCKEQKINHPNVMGFYFPKPIPNFEPPMITDHGTLRKPIFPMISTCCWDCAYMYYFERTMEEVKEIYGYGHTKKDRSYYLNGKLIEKIFTSEEIEAKNLADDLHIQKNLGYYFCTFPKEDLNSGIMIIENEENIEKFDYEWGCDICEMSGCY